MNRLVTQYLLLILLIISSAAFISCGSDTDMSGEGDSGSDSDSGEAPNGARFSEAFFAAGVTSDNRPSGIASTFPLGTRLVYAFATWEDMQNETTCESRWYLGSTEVKRDAFVWRLGQSGTNWVATISSDTQLPAGQYRWELYVQGALVLQDSFILE